MISERTARIIRCMPKPLLKAATKLIINGYISKYANITVVNGEKLKSYKEPVIFVCNHLSNSDGLVLNKVLEDFDVTFVAGVKLSQNALTSLGIEHVKSISINPNSADRAAISKTIKLVKAGKSICIFPEGTRSRTSSLIKGRKGVLLIAKMAKAQIIPLGIEGTEKLMPINDEDMGKERFYHADVKVTVGDNFEIPDMEDDEDRHSYEDRVLYFLMKKIAGLLSPKYRGVYGEQ